MGSDPGPARSLVVVPLLDRLSLVVVPLLDRLSLGAALVLTAFCSNDPTIDEGNPPLASIPMRAPEWGGATASRPW